MKLPVKDKIISQIHQDKEAVKNRVRYINRCNQGVRYFITNKYKTINFVYTFKI